MHTSSNITNIFFNTNEAIYVQIADYFRNQAATGKIVPGDRLPAIRALANNLNIDPGTIARAYRQPEHDGVITCRRGDGSYISTKATEKHLAEEDNEVMKRKSELSHLRINQEKGK